MSGAIPHLPLHAFMAWTGNFFTLTRCSGHVQSTNSCLGLVMGRKVRTQHCKWTVCVSSAAVSRVTAPICVGRL